MKLLVRFLSDGGWLQQSELESIRNGGQVDDGRMEEGVEVGSPEFVDEGDGGQKSWSNASELQGSAKDGAWQQKS